MASEIDPPIKSVEALETAAPSRIAAQLRHEFRRVHLDHDGTQETLAHALNYAGASSLSKWLTGKSPVSARGAAALDENGFGPTTLDISFSELRKAYDRAHRLAKAGTATREKPDATGSYPRVFVGTPMAAHGDEADYSQERRAARDLCAAVETYCNLSTYYAGDDIAGRDDYDAPEIALEENFSVLREADYFVLLAVRPIDRASGVLVEAGFALAQSIPSLYFVTDQGMLPYCLRGASQQRPDSGLPRVHIHQIEAPENASNLVRRHGEELFTRLSA